MAWILTYVKIEIRVPQNLIKKTDIIPKSKSPAIIVETGERKSYADMLGKIKPGMGIGDNRMLEGIKNV